MCGSTGTLTVSCAKSSFQLDGASMRGESKALLHLQAGGYRSPRGVIPGAKWVLLPTAPQPSSSFWHFKRTKPRLGLGLSQQCRRRKAAVWRASSAGPTWPDAVQTMNTAAIRVERSQQQASGSPCSHRRRSGQPSIEELRQPVGICPSTPIQQLRAFT
jgi:hypothetical protein